MHSRDDSNQPPAGVETLVAEFERQVARVGVDPRQAVGQLHAVEAPVSRALPDGTFEESFTIDVSGIVATLRTLPDDAGTAAFVAAYNATHPTSLERPHRDR